MTHHFTISDLGLRLIKAYEGFRAESRELISGERVIGFGHRLADQDIILLTPEEAEKLLREDIAPVEDIVNEAIFAPLTQGQFDALCSLAYNIGREAFLSSDVVKAINNGRPIDAANGFDVWRKGEIDGKIFVIDALVRRRTAEKALFLKPGKIPVTSPRDNVPPVKDEDVAADVAQPDDIFTAQDANNYVGPVPYDARPNLGRRREDGPAGVLELSEYIDDDGEEVRDNLTVDNLDLIASPAFNDDLVSDNDDDVSVRANTPNDDKPAIILSPIAEAAAEVSTRLDALIDDFDAEALDTSDLPDTLLDTGSNGDGVILPFKDQDDDAGTDQDGIDVDLDVQTEEAQQKIETLDDEAQGDSAARFIQTADVQGEPMKQTNSSVVAYAIMLLCGVMMLAFSFYTWMNDPVALIGEIGPIAALVGIMMGGVIIFASIWYIFKSSLKQS